MDLVMFAGKGNSLKIDSMRRSFASCPSLSLFPTRMCFLRVQIQFFKYRTLRNHQAKFHEGIVHYNRSLRNHMKRIPF